MSLAALINQTPAPIPPGIGRKVSFKTAEEKAADRTSVLRKEKSNQRICYQCGAEDNGTNFYTKGTRCKSCQKVNRCLNK